MTLDQIKLASDDPLLFEYVRQVLDYDPVSGELVWVYDVGSALAHSIAGGPARRKFSKELYYKVKVAYHTITAGKLVWFWMTGKFARKVYYYDGNCFNVRWSNLTTDKPRKGEA
jgi:hypothetical protein